MQGFINTTAGLRPVLLDGIEEVTYTTNSGGLYHTGSLGIKYIPNAGTGTGNVFINIPAYDNLQYPIEKFWDWVNSVSAGQNKTYNQFLGSGVVIGAVVGTITTGAGVTPQTGYVIQIADDLPIDDICALTFNTNATPEAANYTNVLTNGGLTPAVFDHIFISSQQGYSPYEYVDAFNLFPSPNNAALPNGTYAYLAGTPQVDDEKGSIIDQNGSVYRIVIKNGIIESVQVCPQVFDVMDLKGWIKSTSSPEVPGCGAQCAQIAICDGCNLSEADWNLGNPVAGWYPVMFAFNNINAPSNISEDPNNPCYQSSYGGNFQSQTFLIPIGASSYIKGFYDTVYVPMTASSQIQWANAPEAQYIGISSLMDYGAMFTASPTFSHVFEIDWGAEGYNDCEGSPITTAYFAHDPTPGGCLQPPAQTFASFHNDSMSGIVQGYAEFPCITLLGNQEP